MKCIFLIVVVLIVGIDCCKNFKWHPFGKESHLAALILARGGSKGIPLKNLAQVGGSTLLRRSINTIFNTRGFDSVWVSTNHHLIADEATRAGVNIHWRSEETATDSATSIFAVQEFLSHHPEVDFVALIQCTSPFTKPSHLQEAVDLLTEEDVDCVFSVTKSHKLRWVENEDGSVIPLNFDPKKRPRRQDWVGEFIENGMFYFSSRHLLMKGYFQNNR